MDFFKQKKLNLKRGLLCNQPKDKVIIPGKGPSGTVRFRDSPPSHYTCTIPAFSTYSKLYRLNSPVFEEGGYKWRLSLYPKGNMNENSKERYLSLNLVMADTGSLPLGWEVKVIFRLFMFNFTNGKYMMMEDTHERCFHEIKKEWGFSKFLDLKKLSNGYVISDTCVIGAEVFVMKNNGKRDCLSLPNELTSAECEWTIENFSELEDNFYLSAVFSTGDYKWNIKFKPGNDVYLGLTLADSTTLSNGKQVLVRFTMGIEDQKNQTINYFPAQSWFGASNRTWGFHKFMSLRKLTDQRKGFVKDDMCIIRAKVTVLNITS